MKAAPHRPANRNRKLSGPWIIVEVPMVDRDPVYPSRRRFYAQGTSDESQTEFIDKAYQFTERAAADWVANRLMHRSRNTWAEVVPFSIAWALEYSGGAPWEPRLKEGEVRDAPKP